MKKPLLSIIILSYNTKQLLRDCLKSVFDSIRANSSEKSNRFVNYEVIVVDNASGDGSPGMVEKEFPQVKLVVNQKNLGFAKGNNQGIKVAKGDYLLLLNSDTIVLDRALEKMVRFMEENKKIGISSCQLLNKDKSIQATGGFFPTLPRVLAWMFFLDDLPFIGKIIKPYHPHEPHFYTKNSFYQKAHLQDWVTGAFFMVRKEVVEKTGLLDPDYFMYVEEVDYCYRAKKAGFEIFYNPVAQIIHLGGKSLKSPGQSISREFEGLKLFYQKHYPSWQLPLLVLFLKIGAILRFVLFGIILKSSKAKEDYVKAFKQAV